MTADARGEGILTTHCPCCKNMPYQHFLPVKCQWNASHFINKATHESAVSCVISLPCYTMWDSFTSPVPVAQVSTLYDSSLVHGEPKSMHTGWNLCVFSFCISTSVDRKFNKCAHTLQLATTVSVQCTSCKPHYLITMDWIRINYLIFKLIAKVYSLYWNELSSVVQFNLKGSPVYAYLWRHFSSLT